MSDQLSAASPDRLRPVVRVPLEISELVHLDCVTDAKRNHENSSVEDVSSQPHLAIGCKAVLSGGPVIATETK